MPSTDRPLVADAVHLDAHLFLAKDQGILAYKQGLRPFGLLIATPGDLLEQLCLRRAPLPTGAPDRLLAAA